MKKYYDQLDALVQNIPITKAELNFAMRWEQWENNYRVSYGLVPVEWTHGIYTRQDFTRAIESITGVVQVKYVKEIPSTFGLVEVSLAVLESYYNNPVRMRYLQDDINFMRRYMIAFIRLDIKFSPATW